MLFWRHVYLARPSAASHAGALLRMSGKGCGLPFLPRPRCSRARRNPEQHSPQLYNTCALLLGPESIARLEMGRCPSPVIRHPSSHYQINHNLIFATAIHSQHINHTLIFKLTPPEPHNQSQLNLHIDHQLINKFSAYNPLHLIRINGHALSRKSS